MAAIVFIFGIMAYVAILYISYALTDRLFDWVEKKLGPVEKGDDNE